MSGSEQAAHPLKVLFVCSRNKLRSPTAEKIFSGQPGWLVRSAGTEEGARIKITAGHIGWADVIVVMEKKHKERLRQKFPEALSDKQCHCLFIPDDYQYMEPALIELLRVKMREYFPGL
jgi:predicted protein tyrosine phosphatase